MNTGQLFIAGTWRAPASGSTYDTINPATEETSAQVGRGDERDVDAAVAAARTAFDSGPWPRMSAAERGRIVWKLGDLIMQNLDEMAKLESLNTGKTLFDSGKVEIPFAAEVFRYYAGWATKIHGETLALRDNAFTFTLRQPVGVVGAIVPWNFPFLLSSWKIAPALAAGNTMVLKPASQTPLTALKFAELCQEAGLPEGVFNDADMEAAVRGAMTGIFYNKGEVCAAGSRLFLEQSVHDEFMSKLTDRVKTLKVGDPLDKTTRMGPVVSKAQMETVLSYIEAGKREGAEVVAGGGRAQVGGGKGFFVEPTIFDRVTNSMKIAREEIFGPVLSVIPFRSVEDGIAQGNQTSYGLAAAVWTRDVSKALKAAKAIRAGTVWVNAYNLFDAALPFGGFKESGFGREMGSVGLDNYTEVKTVWADLS